MNVIGSVVQIKQSNSYGNEFYNYSGVVRCYNPKNRTVGIEIPKHYHKTNKDGLYWFPESDVYYISKWTEKENKMTNTNKAIIIDELMREFALNNEYTLSVHHMDDGSANYVFMDNVKKYTIVFDYSNIDNVYKAVTESMKDIKNSFGMEDEDIYKYARFACARGNMKSTKAAEDIFEIMLNRKYGFQWSVKNIIFNSPATIVFWTDGTKTVVKCGKNDVYDPEKGLAMAIAKKAFGNEGNYYKVFKKWLPKEEPEHESCNPCVTCVLPERTNFKSIGSADLERYCFNCMHSNRDDREEIPSERADES